MKKIFIESYGCSANLSDAEVMVGLLKENRFEIVDSPKKSDLNIINTCIVKIPTEQRMIYRIRELTKLKKPLIVAGCMPKTSQKLIENLNPVASMVGPDAVEKIINVVCCAMEGRKSIFLKDLRRPKICLPKIRSDQLIGVVPISIGCLGECSYCSVKFAKGRLLSYPKEKILQEVKYAISDGCKEIWITSQDNSCYGRDIDSSLPELLNEICKIDGEFFVRVGMMNPLHAMKILDELIEVYKNEKIFKFLHLPVQSGSDRILKMMKRKYEVKDFVRIVEKFRKEFPFLTLSTDAIIGFPTETEEDFKKTVNLIKKIKPNIVNISKFGARPNTEASRLNNAIDARIVNERSRVITKVVRQISFENNKKWLGWEGEVLFDEKLKNGFVGRNFAYKSIFIDKKNIFGKFLKIKIITAKNNFLIGKIFDAKL